VVRTIAKDHDEKRGQILKAAAKIFATEGFDRASMTQLAQECGISKANIYHYYGGKDAILFDILDNYLSTLRNRIVALDFRGKSATDRLRETIVEILRAYQGSDHEHQVQINGFATLPEDQQATIRSYQRDLVRFLSDRIDEAAPETFANDRGKLRAVTMSVFGMLNWFFMWNGEADATARDDYADLVARLTLKGLPGL